RGRFLLARLLDQSQGPRHGEAVPEHTHRRVLRRRSLRPEHHRLPEGGSDDHPHVARQRIFLEARSDHEQGTAMFPVKKKLLALGVVPTTLSISTAVTPARAVGGVDLQVTKFALEKGVFNAIFAKELCSCQFVDGLTLDECKARDNLPGIAH